MILETERLILREYNESDLETVHEYASDPDVVRYMLFGPNTLEDTASFIQKQLAYQDTKPRLIYDMPLVLKLSGNLIGACSIHISRPEHREGSIGYILNKKYWNQGFVTEAGRRLMQFGFEELKLHRISAICDPANIGSYRVMEKIGMQREGHLRENAFVRGRWRDSLLYSVLEHEWNIA